MKKIVDLKIGDKVLVSDDYEKYTGITIPPQILEKIKFPFFWSQHLKGAYIKDLKAVIIDGDEIIIEHEKE